MTDNPEPTSQTAALPNLTGCGGFTDAERRGVKRLADRIRFELHCCRGESSEYLDRRSIALSVLEEALS